MLSHFSISLLKGYFFLNVGIAEELYFDIYPVLTPVEVLQAAFSVLSFVIEGGLKLNHLQLELCRHFLGINRKTILIIYHGNDLDII